MGTGIYWRYIVGTGIYWRYVVATGNILDIYGGHMEEEQPVEEEKGNLVGRREGRWRTRTGKLRKGIKNS